MRLWSRSPLKAIPNSINLLLQASLI